MNDQPSPSEVASTTLRAERVAATTPRELAWLVGVLAWPFVVHASVVGCSALGAQPLASRAFALTILLLASVASVALGIAVARTGNVHERDTRSLPVRLRIASWALIGGAISAQLLALCAAISLPIVAYDALGYRLPVIAQWLDAGRVTWVVTDDQVRNGYPLGQEAISAVVAAAVGGVRFATTTSFVFCVCGALAIIWAARSAGVRPRLAQTAGVLFLLVPMVLLNAPSAYADAAFAGAVIALLCTASFLDLERTSLRESWPLALALGMSAAHVLSLKGTGLPFAVVVLGACVLRALLSKRFASLRVLGSAIAIALPGLYWALRNLIHTGNPLWPIRMSVSGHVILPGTATADEVLDVLHNTPAVLAKLPAVLRVAMTWSQIAGVAVDYDHRLGGLGWAWPLLGVPAIASWLWHVRSPHEPRWRKLVNARFAKQPLTFLLLLTAICFVLQPINWWARYTLWLWGAGAVAIAIECERLLHTHARALGLAALLASVLVLGEAGSALAHVQGIHLAVGRLAYGEQSHDPSWHKAFDLHLGLNAVRWLEPEFWTVGLDHERQVCRTGWSSVSDDANLDGVLAQVEPRPHVHTIIEAKLSWAAVKDATCRAGCRQLMVLRGSPIWPALRADSEVSIQRAEGFDPFYMVRPQAGSHAFTSCTR